MRDLIAGGALLLAAVGLAGTGVRADTVGFTSFWAFGDSLSDDGNLYAETGGQSPPPPYSEGRFSNGSVWAEGIAADFTAQGLAAENFAYGGAAVTPLAAGPFPSPPVVNLDGQIGMFADASRGRLGARPVASLWIGANDLLFNGVPNGAARRVGREAARGVARGALELRDLGVRDVVLFNLPSLDMTPAFTSGPAAAARQARIGTRAFNATLDRRADALRSRGINVIEIDAFALFNDLLDDPAKYGVVDATTPCFVPTLGIYCGPDVAPLRAFFDPVHPNATVHAGIADIVRGEVAPVPLPAPAALLFAGLGALALTRWRRAQGSRIA